MQDIFFDGFGNLLSIIICAPILHPCQRQTINIAVV